MNSKPSHYQHGLLQGFQGEVLASDKEITLENAHSGDCQSDGKVEYYGNKLVTHCSFCSKVIFK